MKTNTSIHNLNADKRQSIYGKILWLLLNFVNNKLLPDRSEGLDIADFSPEIKEKDWENVYIKSSPSRALSDLFWLKLDWKAIKEELGSINIFDTGTGKGGYALKLNNFSNGITKFFGVDIASHAEWNTIMREFQFVSLKQHTSNDIGEVIPQDTNFFMSQSAIEHFENDLLYFRQIKRFVDKTQADTIQVHMFPSAACLKLYLWHGIRQYTPRTIATIAQLFNSEKSYSVLYRLGGQNCNNLHYRFITKPLWLKKVDWRDLKTEEYIDLLKIAVKNDAVRKNRNPSFYALIIHSNFKIPIFKTMKVMKTDSP